MLLPDFLFRRQFILCDKIFKPTENWINIPLHHGLILSSHPDLHIQTEITNKNTMTFIGYIIDPRYPSRSMKEILEKMEKDNLDITELILQTYPYSGRWVIIYQDQKNTFLFTDPCGFRQAFYSSNGNKVFCGSQPEIIDAVNSLELTTSPDILDFILGKDYTKHESDWIGNKTIYRNCYHLLPNNYLIFNKFESHRFAPINKLLSENKSSLLEKSALLIEGSIETVVKRENVWQALTAGWDSRVLLAASRKYSQAIKYFVDRKGQISQWHPDISIPKRLSKKLGFDLHIINSTENPSGIFITLLSKNVTGARVLPKTRSIYANFLSQNPIIKINGNGSEICRNFYNKSGDLSDTDYNYIYLAKIFGYDKSRFAERELNEWKNQIMQPGNNNVRILDLLYWEQRLGNWGAQFPAEQDIANEEFSPFNNRLLIQTLLSVPIEFRKAPKYYFYRDLIDFMWPETLSLPINPPKGLFLRAIEKFNSLYYK